MCWCYLPTAGPVTGSQPCERRARMKRSSAAAVAAVNRTGAPLPPLPRLTSKRARQQVLRRRGPGRAVSMRTLEQPRFSQQQQHGVVALVAERRPFAPLGYSLHLVE